MATCEAYSNKPHRRETGLLAGMMNERLLAPPPKNVLEQNILEDVGRSQKRYNFFKANNLLIARE